ncbi:hypothetical protein HaLaN_15822 [Haematococcus lacustris]|uniref:Uncharacterized protein n=1 Tax=Haematococcus lacustris TaxID=44745 RepID=A0A699ZJF6_HAELA|nr:hypothetical protein HaLaN_15822 [Haematococcus lacustris]
MGQFGSHRPPQDIAFAPARSIAQAVPVSLASSMADGGGRRCLSADEPIVVVSITGHRKNCSSDALQTYVTVQSNATGAGGASLVLVCPDFGVSLTGARH